MRFRDRADAGQRLAAELVPLRREAPIVLAIPRGGVPVGYEVARALAAPLDVLVVRKVGSPDQPGMGVGAIAEGGSFIPEAHSLWLLGATRSEVQHLIEDETRELERRVYFLRGSRPLPDVTGRTVILVDDGVRHGLTVRAAIQALRSRHPKRLVLAVPCGVTDTISALRHEVDTLVCLDRADRDAIALWYSDFPKVSDAEVIELLDLAQRGQATQPPAP